MDHLERGHRIDQLARAAGRPRHGAAIPVGRVAIAHDRAAVVGAVDNLAAAVLHKVDDAGFHRPPLVGENRIGVRQPQDRGVARAERKGQIIAVIADAENVRGRGDLRHADGRGGAHGHQVARLLDAPAEGMRPRRPAVEIDEAFLAEPGALPDAEGRIHFDRRRSEAVLEGGDIDDRLERRSRLAKRLDRAVVARSDDVESSLHRHHPAGVDFLDQHPARDFGNRAQRKVAAADLLDDDDHSRLEEIEGPAAHVALGLGGVARVQHTCRAVGEADAGLRVTLVEDDGLAPVGIASSDRRRVKPRRPVLREVDLHAEIRPAPAAVETGQPVAHRLSCGVLRHRVHRAAHPQTAAVKAVGPVLRLLAELLDQLAADFFHEIAALLAEFLVAAVADGAELRRVSRAILVLGDVAVLVHFAQDVATALERLLGRALRVVIGRRARQHRKIGGLRQRQFVDVFVEIGARGGLDSVGVTAEEDRVEVNFEDLLLGQGRFEPEGEDRLADLAPDVVARILQQIFGDLLGNRRAAGYSARPSDMGGVIEYGLDRAGHVDARMREKILVLGRDEGMHHERRKLIVGQLHAALAGEGLDRRAIEAADVGRQRRLIGEQGLRRRQTAGKIDPHRNQQSE